MIAQSRIRPLVSALILSLVLAFVAVPVRAADPADPADPAGNALKQAGFTEITEQAPGVILDIRYATPNNFTGKTVYPAARCFLRKDVAERLMRVEKALAKEGLGVKIFDCYRPISVQKKFWDLVPDERYVAKPVMKDGKWVEGSRHNRGAAVDITLVDAKGQELPMPTPFDDFTEKASRAYTGGDPAARANAKKLEAAMAAEGFEPLPTEWWHFDGPGWQSYELLDMPNN